jgi:flagellar basal body-associated protein FliL
MQRIISIILAIVVLGVALVLPVSAKNEEVELKLEVTDIKYTENVGRPKIEVTVEYDNDVGYQVALSHSVYIETEEYSGYADIYTMPIDEGKGAVTLEINGYAGKLLKLEIPSIELWGGPAGGKVESPENVLLYDAEQGIDSAEAEFSIGKSFFSTFFIIIVVMMVVIVILIIGYFIHAGKKNKAAAAAFNPYSAAVPNDRPMNQNVNYPNNNNGFNPPPSV